MSRITRFADVIAVASLVLFIVGGVVASYRAEPSAVVSVVVQGSGFVVCFGAVGWVLVRRLPRNPVGWCFSLSAFSTAVAFLAHGYARLALADPPPDALARAAAAVDTWIWMLSIPLAVSLPLLYLPDGRLRSRRWKPVVWVVLAGCIVGTFGALTTPGLVENPLYPAMVNPMGVTALGPLPRFLVDVGLATLACGAVSGMVAVVLRFRGSSGVQRQQLLWVAVGGLCGLIGILFGSISQDPGDPGVIGGIGSGIGVGAVPVCLGVAVLRYRLYDLGRVVSRTVSYAVITALLVGVYLVLVTGSTWLLSDSSSSWAVAASTLAAAALFQPLRRRVQAVVNRRFNRSRYDADRTVEAFTRTLREDVALDAVRSDLLTTVHETLQPASLGLWLRPSDEVRP